MYRLLSLLICCLIYQLGAQAQSSTIKKITIKANREQNEKKQYNVSSPLTIVWEAPESSVCLNLAKATQKKLTGGADNWESLARGAETPTKSGNFFMLEVTYTVGQLGILDNDSLVIRVARGNAFDTITLQFVSTAVATPTATTDVGNSIRTATFFDSTTLAAVRFNGTCNSCDKEAAIKSKVDRKFSTDYLITYDPEKATYGDIYTICKHIYVKSDKLDKLDKDRLKALGKLNTDEFLHERYRRKAHKYFTPPVGSSITFEAVNIPLAKPISLVVDEKDLFNGGSTQFASIISGLASSQIVTPLTSSASGNKTGSGSQQGSETKPAKVDSIEQEKLQLLANLQGLNNELVEYISQFRVSSCSIEAHRVGMVKLLAIINQIFGTSAGSFGQLENGLKNLADEKLKGTERAQAMQAINAIIAALKSLDGISPIVYATMRAKNRDYIEIKYRDAAGVESRTQNIRMGGGMKIDFSAGFVLTGLKDYTYVLKPDSARYTPTGASPRDTIGNVITQEPTGNRDIGISLLTHFYPRISSHYNIGGAVGLMTSTELNLRLMLGGSFIISSLFGSDNRISFTGGVVWGKVKRLSVQQERHLNNIPVVNNVPQFFSGTPTLADRSEKSWFFSVNFNFGGN